MQAEDVTARMLPMLRVFAILGGFPYAVARAIGKIEKTINAMRRRDVSPSGCLALPDLPRLETTTTLKVARRWCILVDTKREVFMMAKTMIDIDDDLISEAAEILGTKTKRATVEMALRATTAKRARQRLTEAIAESGQTPEELDRIMREEAWR